jgi:hypothetical protein
MKNTVSVELKNENALNLLYDLEKMDIIHIVREPEIENLYIDKKVNDVSDIELPKKNKLSDSLKGLLTKEQGLDLKRHVEEMRNEWNDIL